MILRKFLWFSVLALTACSSQQDNKPIAQTLSQSAIKDSSHYHWVKDTSQHSITENLSLNVDPFLKKLLNKKQFSKNGNYFMVTASSFADTTGTILWGNDTLKRIYQEPFYLWLIERLKVEWENQNYMILQYGVGSGAWETIVLPINKKEMGERFDNGLCFDKKNNLLVVQGQALNDTILIVKNLNTHQKQFIIEKEKHCESANYLYCIDSISIHDKLLYYKWVTPNFADENKESVERRIRVTI